ncbi:serine-rich adhesin for platelets-like [Palaemon carinicauda]|uniref:serine-rich adhesin for platelets-like n=1 Tax=Palaemon carinicauda TaxID=392227 RepID=UPI0035B62091
MARRRLSRRRSSSGTTKGKGPRTRNDGVSFKSKGQTDFTSNKQTVMENGNAGDRKENCDPQGNMASPLHRPNHMNSLINVNSGRDSACSDDAPISSSSLYTSSSSTPTCDTPSLSSYDGSRTGTPLMRTPSIRTPSMRTPSLFGSSFDNSSFDASSLDFESNTSSLCGTPVTPRRGGHPLDLSSSQEESSEESRARKRTEKRKRYRRNKRLRMLAAMHLENLEKEKHSKMASSVIKEDEAVTTAEVIIEVPAINNGVVCSAEGTEKGNDTDEVKPTPVLTTLKERDSVEEVVDEGFSENFDKAQRKNLEETIITSTATTETLINGNKQELAVDVINIEVGEIRYQEDCENGNAAIGKYTDGLDQSSKNEVDQITSDVLDKHILNENSSEVELQEIGVASCSEEEKDSVSEEDSGQEQGTDDPPKDTDSSESTGSSSEGVTEEEEIVTPVKVETASTSLTSGQLETETGKSSHNSEEIKSETLPADEQVDEEIDTVVCTKALSDETTSAVVNDNLHLINSYDKLELVDVIETNGCQENLVVLEMKNNRESPVSESDDSVAQEREQNNGNDLNNENDLDTEGQVRLVEENEDGDKVIDIPIIMETGYEEIFPKERVELVDVIKAEDGEDDDIVIFEVQNEEEKDNEDDEEEENDIGMKEDVDNEISDKVFAGKEVTDSGNDSGSKEEVEIAQNAGQQEEEVKVLVSNDMNKEEPVCRDEAKKPAGKVDAALAELDSIPDGVCESGEVEEEEEDEEEWSYYRMEPQTHPQGEDVITSGAPAAAPTKPAEDIEIIPEPVDMVHDQDIVPAEEPKVKTEDILVDHLEESTDLIEKSENHDIVENINEPTVIARKTPDILESNMDMIPSLDDHPERLINFSGPGLEKMDLIDTGLEQNSPNGSGSPRAPGSPRSVEGFVTSVELNTADESFATNFAVNQAQDGFTGPVMDQTSGPFSVYVSSSPEPASLDPPALSSVDLLNMSASMTNGQIDDEHPVNATEIRDESPVEIVHAQSTVEVVAPPSPVDKIGLDTPFMMPDQQVPDSPVSAHMPPTDISFVPQPIVEPSAEVPVPVYVDDTPVSEPELIPDVIEEVNAVSKTEIETESFTETLVSKVESFVETTQVEAHSFMETETSSQMVAEFETKDELLQLNSSPVPAVSPAEEKDVPSNLSPEPIEAKSPEPVEAPVLAKSPEPVLAKSPEPVLAKSPEPVLAKSPEPVLAKSPEPVLAKSPEPVLAKSPEPVEAKSPELVEAAKSPEPVEAVKSPEPVEAPVEEAKLPEPVEVKSPEPIKSPEPAVAKTPKAAKTPAKSTGEKAATKPTPGKATPGRSTPAKATPKSTPSSTRTPSTRTPTTKTPLTKPAEKKTPTSKPASPAVASRTTAPRPASARPASATTTTKSTVPRTAAPKPSTKPAPAKPSTTRTSLTASKPTTKPAGTTVPKAGSTTKPSTTRPTSASTTGTTTAARKPLGATRSADKTDGKLVNGTARPSSRPGTARPAGTTTATRKPLTSTTATKTASKPGAEKETKNTTNKILSTRPTKPATTTKSAPTKASATHSTTRTTSKVSDSANAAKSRVATTTKTIASKTTGAATKKTLVSKSKTSQAGTKETSIKTKTEAEVITQAEPLVNGENKIADEETSVEVIEKSVVEDIMQASSEKIITETMSSEQMVVTTETTEVLVNGDH